MPLPEFTEVGTLGFARRDGDGKSTTRDVDQCPGRSQHPQQQGASAHGPGHRLSPGEPGGVDRRSKIRVRTHAIGAGTPAKVAAKPSDEATRMGCGRVRRGTAHRGTGIAQLDHNQKGRRRNQGENSSRPRPLGRGVPFCDSVAATAERYAATVAVGATRRRPCCLRISSGGCRVASAATDWSGPAARRSADFKAWGPGAGARRAGSRGRDAHTAARIPRTRTHARRQDTADT